MLAVLHSTVRRLTPLECERLQGYPDEWTDIGEWTDSKGKKHQTTDSARYKALGNSIALPPWRFVCRRICEQYDTTATMGSLFDGIGGFPLIWREINGADSVPWACEIDEYCRAVTQRRLP
jgi:DNA (cytosine-5)-methyltransferase 1